MWMFHCHILDHADGGLMGHVHLRPESGEHNQR
jgi:FtsP/CotA-like multicopper oxidase with cupredoxin domain